MPDNRSRRGQVGVYARPRSRPNAAVWAAVIAAVAGAIGLFLWLS